MELSGYFNQSRVTQRTPADIPAQMVPICLLSLAVCPRYSKTARSKTCSISCSAYSQHDITIFMLKNRLIEKLAICYKVLKPYSSNLKVL